jgi:hypothetical protein
MMIFLTAISLLFLALVVIDNVDAQPGEWFYRFCAVPNLVAQLRHSF